MKSIQLRRQHGFSLLESMFAVVILAVGLLSLLGLFGQAVAAMKFSQEDLIAKQKAREALEGVYSARNSTSLTFDQIQNISNGGIFKDGFQSLFLPGANGVVGTAQDSTTLDRVVLPGPDGQLNTADDVIMPLTNLQRQVLIEPVLNPDTSVNSDLRHITVTVRVSSPGRGIRDYVVAGYVSRFQ
jgi:prepilin-type N-terminal cleavage/methylation domain-containing protein